jgi:hypothetical protein
VFNSLCAAQGSAAIFEDFKSSKMKEPENHIFPIPLLKKPWIGFFNNLLGNFGAERILTYSCFGKRQADRFMSNMMAVLLNGVAQFEYDREQELPIFHAAYLRKMDKKMDLGIMLDGEFIEKPDANQRAMFVAMTLYQAMKGDELTLSQACATYLAENQPELKQVKFDDRRGEVEVELVYNEAYIKQQKIDFPGVKL